MEIFSLDGWYVLLRWFHVLSGITWIGILYYFNFVQTPFFGSELGGQAKGPMTRGLVPNALWWFRWGAMFTFITGLLILSTKLFHDNVPMDAPYMTRILSGALMGTLMWFNVWFVIWPAQKVVIASAESTAAGGQADPSAAARGAVAGRASRTNTLLSIPMLFFMVAASHFPGLAMPAMGGGPGLYWICALILIAVFELNPFVATPLQKSLASVKGTIHLGFVLAIALYLVMEVTI
jgi:uncharacterized membrane protein